MSTRRPRRPAPFDLPARAVADVRLCGSGVSVTVRGDVDVHTAPQLEAQLREVVAQREEQLSVHLDDVTFLDSTGLGVLVAAWKGQTAQGGRFVLVCTQPRLLRLLEVTGLDRVLLADR